MNFPVLNCCSARASRATSALCSLVLVACAAAAPPELPPLTWQLTSDDPVASVSWPLTDISAGVPPERRLVLTLDSAPVEPGQPFYHLLVEIHCPDGRGLLKSTALADFPPGVGGRFVLYLPAPEEHCREVYDDMPIQVTLTLSFIDDPQPLQLKGRVHVQ